jgi:hypothetical protein
LHKAIKDYHPSSGRCWLRPAACGLVKLGRTLAQHWKCEWPVISSVHLSHGHPFVRPWRHASVG